jgi:AbrB family looped-hinge helix DNA binding protein
MSATATVMVDTTGRVVIPAKVRQEMGIEGSEELVMSLDENGVLTLVSKKAARLAARQAVKRLVKPGVSLSGELIGERRQDGD